MVGPPATDPGAASAVASEVGSPPEPEPQRSAILPVRVWRFLGYFHPAVVHFPIALLMVGGLFVFVGLWSPTRGNHVALACLYLGTVSAVVASAVGWSFASQSGYGGWAKFDFKSDVFWHRWSGVTVTVLAVLVSMMAWRAGSGAKWRLIWAMGWKIGLVLLAVLVGLVGHQGGHLTFGKGHYDRAFDALRGPNAAATAVEQPAAEQEGPAEEAAAESGI